MPIRVYDIANKLGIESTIVMAKAKELGIASARFPYSSLDTITAEYLENELQRPQFISATKPQVITVTQSDTQMHPVNFDAPDPNNPHSVKIVNKQGFQTRPCIEWNWGSRT